MGPAGLHMNSAYPAECIGGAAGYIDRWLLSLDHIYKYPTARTVYQSGPFDPEGILGELGFFSSLLFGLHNVDVAIDAGVVVYTLISVLPILFDSFFLFIDSHQSLHHVFEKREKMVWRFFFIILLWDFFASILFSRLTLVSKWWFKKTIHIPLLNQQFPRTWRIGRCLILFRA